MRPDTRSFSFTWLKGQQHQHELNLGRGRNRSQHLKSATSVRLEGEPSPNQNRMTVQQRCSVGRLRNFRASSIWNPKKYVAIDENDVQKEEDEPMESSGNDKKEKDPNTSESGSGSKSSISGSLGKRLNKTVQEVKNSFDNLSQMLRRSTRRRYRMASPLTNEVSPTRRILGRTPTKLYSPFGFDTPTQRTPLGLVHPSTPRLARRTLTPGRVYSPSNNFKSDVRDASRGLRELHMLSRDIVRRSVRF